MAPVVYNGVIFFSSQTQWSWLNYLSAKPISQYVDRLRLILFFGFVLVFIIRWHWWKHFRLNTGICYYLRAFLLGCGLWLILFLIITQFARPSLHFHHVWIEAFIGSFCVAFLEELIFRGFCLDVLREKHALRASIILLTLIFAFMHFSICKNIPADGSVWEQSFKCIYFSIIDIPKNIKWIYFWCLCELNVLLIYFRMRDKTLWSCIGFHQGLVFTLMVLRKIFYFPAQQSPWWGTGRLTDAWFVVVVLGVLCGTLFLKKKNVFLRV